MNYLSANLDAYKESYDFLSTSRPTPTGLPSAVTLCSLAVFEGMVKFLPASLLSSSQETESRNTNLSGDTNSRYLSGVIGPDLEDQKQVPVFWQNTRECLPRNLRSSDCELIG